MKVSDIYDFLNVIAPSETALSFDNVGILVGDPSTEVQKSVVALDCTPAVVKKAVAENAQLIITHHPVIFEPLKSVVKGNGNVVYDCIQNGISVISMHTNLDVAAGGVNDCLAKALELEQIEEYFDGTKPIGRKGKSKISDGVEFAELIKKKGYSKEKIRADSAEPKSNDDLRRMGISRIHFSVAYGQLLAISPQFFTGKFGQIHPSVFPYVGGRVAFTF